MWIDRKNSLHLIYLFILLQIELYSDLFPFLDLLHRNVFLSSQSRSHSLWIQLDSMEYANEGVPHVSRPLANRLWY